MKLHIKKIEVIFLVSLMVLGFFLRAYKLDTDLLFHRDQGLHSLLIWNIWHDHKFSLLGHTSDVDGLIHAPIYFWLMTPSYAISNGDPVVASLFQILLEMLSLPFLYIGVKKLFDQKTSILTIIFYVTSYGLISYSRWLSNVTPIFPLTNILIFFLASYQDKSSNLKLFILSLLVGLITQMNAAVGLFLLPLLLYLLATSFTPFKLLATTFGFFLPALPLAVFELRHQFVIASAILNFSRGQTHAGLSLSPLITSLNVYFTEIVHALAYEHNFIILLLCICSFIPLWRNKHRWMVIIFIFMPILSLSLLKRGAISFFFVDIITISIAVISYGLSRFPKILFVPLVVLILFINLKNIPAIYTPTNALIPIGDANIITIQNRKNIIDWIYAKSKQQSFSLWFYTLPYFQEEVWQYPLLWYALPHYGYLPEKTGGFSPADLKTSVYFFAVFEPDPDNQSRFDSWQSELTTNFGTAIDSYQSGGLFVRQFKVTR